MMIRLDEPQQRDEVEPLVDVVKELLRAESEVDQRLRMLRLDHDKRSKT